MKDLQYSQEDTIDYSYDYFKKNVLSVISYRALASLLINLSSTLTEFCDKNNFSLLVNPNRSDIYHSVLLYALQRDKIVTKLLSNTLLLFTVHRSPSNASDIYTL